MQTQDTRHNGWTNYATWRVNLEIFDGLDREYFTDEVGNGDAYVLSKRLKEFAENILDDDGTREGLAVDYARVFLSDVNWYEIAEHMIDDYKSEAA